MNGVLVSEAAVPAAPLLQSARVYTEIGGFVDTGMAIANPNPQQATIDFYFTNEAGVNINSGVTSIPPIGKLTVFLDQSPFLGTTNARTFTINSSVPVSIIALRSFINERSESLFTTLPVTPVNATISTPLILPHFADGGGWTTQVILVNPTDDALTGTVQFFSQGSSAAPGQALNITINGAAGSNFAYSIAPRSSFKLITSGTDPSVRVGSVCIVPAASTRAPSGLAVFGFRNAAVTVTEAGVPALAVGSAFNALQLIATTNHARQILLPTPVLLRKKYRESLARQAVHVPSPHVPLGAAPASYGSEGGGVANLLTSAAGLSIGRRCNRSNVPSGGDQNAEPCHYLFAAWCPKTLTAGYGHRERSSGDRLVPMARH